MNKDYIGKICPYCKTPLAQGDAVVFCSICDMPHHKDCWKENQGCTTFGCTGTIKEIVESAIPPTVAPTERQSMQMPRRANVPINVPPILTSSEQKEKPIEVLHESKEMVFMSDAPVVLENTALIIDRKKDKLYVRCTFRSISDKEIKAMLIEVSCYDVWGGTLGAPIAFQYLDLRTKREMVFGQTNPITLADNTTRKVRVTIKKILFADDTVLPGGETLFTMPEPLPLEQYLDSDELAAQYVRDTNKAACFAPVFTELYWRCACGSIGHGLEERCHQCGCTKEQLIAALNPDTLSANLLVFQAEQKAIEEKAQAEMAERIRIAEVEAERFRQVQEQTRIEQEKKEREVRETLRKKRKKNAFLFGGITFAVLAIIGCIVVFFGIPYANYKAACEALSNEEYDTAYQAFISLDGFMDSAEMAKETRYREASAAVEDKQFDAAIQIFTELGDYKDSADQITEATYQKGLDALENKEFDTAIQIFTELGDYKDGVDQIVEATYQKGLAALDNKEFDTAIQIFTELDDYKDSNTLVLEAKYGMADDFESKQQFASAYKLFVELGSYEDASTRVKSCIYKWADYVLFKGSITEATIFKKTVGSFKSDQCATIYGKIKTHINNHTDFDYWDDRWHHTERSAVIHNMLLMLPSTYEDTLTLRKLFGDFTSGAVHPTDYIRNNREFLKSAWSFGVVQDFLKSDDMICVFLEGNWRGGGYYLKFTFQEGGGTYSQFDLPWVSKPKGTKYYDIEDMIYYWDDENGNHLAKVFRFTIIDFDTIQVYCYKNNRAYKMTRK